MLDIPDFGSDPRNRQSIQIITRASNILHVLQRHSDGLLLGELAKQAYLPRSTVKRIVDTLAVEGILIADTASSRVRLGPTLITLGAAADYPMAELARPTLQSLATETKETIFLTCIREEEIIVIDRVDASHRLASVLGVSETLPIYCSASGKAIMAALPLAALTNIKEKIKFIKYTDKTITSWEKLLQNLDEIRQRNLAFDLEEHSQGVSSIAASISSANGERFAIAITAPTQRFTENKKFLVEKLVDYSGALQQMLNPN